MAKRKWIFLINTFLVNTFGNFKKTLTLITDHLSKLESQNSDADILAMFTTFEPLKESFENLYAQWQLTQGTREGKTQGFTERLQYFSVERINVWRGIVFSIFPENTPAAREIFYNDRQPFQAGTYEQRVNAFKTLGDKLAEYTTHAPLVALSTEVLSAHNELKALRDAQQNKEGATAIFADSLETARVIVCQEMYSNLGLLMSKYKQTPDTIADYFDLSLLRKTGGTHEVEREVSLGPGAAGNFSLAGINLEKVVSIEYETINANAQFYAAASPTDFPGGTVHNLAANNTVVKTMEQVVTELGFGETLPYMNVRNNDIVPGVFKLTFTVED